LIPDVKQEILIVAEEGREEEVVTRMARVGYDYCIGYLKGGIDAWKNAGKEIDRIRNISAEDLSKSTNPDIIDVRKPAEYAEGHISGASNFPLDYINDSISTIDKTRTNFIHCAGGYRSMVFASILKARGFQDVVNIEGGFKSIQETGLYTIVK